MRVVKLSEYAEMCGVTYRTVWNRFKEDKIKNAYKDEFGKQKVIIQSIIKQQYMQEFHLMRIK